MIDNIRDAIEPIIVAKGYEIVDITFDKQFGTDTLTVYIYNRAGISLDDCTIVNDAISPILDEVDPTQGKPYNLNVSSPGLDRPIVSADDLRRSLEQDVEATLKKPTADGKKKAHGILTSYTEEIITLTTDKGTIELARDNIKKLQLYIKF